MRKLLLPLLLCLFPVLAMAGTIGPVDSYVDMTSQTTGAAMTVTILNNGTEGAQNWDEILDNNSSVSTSSYFSVQASQNALPNSVSVLGGSTYTTSHTTKTIRLDNSSPYEDLITNLASKSVISFGGWITFGPPDLGVSAKTFDYAFIFGTGGTYAGLQLRSGAPYGVWIETGGGDTPGGITHSQRIPITPGSTYWCTLQANWTTGYATLEVFNTSLQEVGYVNTQMDNANTSTEAYFGNNETGTASGYYSYFEDLVIDSTSGKFPLGPSSVPATYSSALLIGGGGAGGSFSGGGGAGGYVLVSPITLTVQTYTVTIGAGGTGYCTSDTGQAGGSGGNTTFAGYTAYGGGGGGSRDGTLPGTAGNGGSGGGSSPSYTATLGAGGTGTAGQGYAGGNETTAGEGGGGGGGAGAVGGNAAVSTAGAGGVGLSTDVSGNYTEYSCGGGGGAYSGDFVNPPVIGAGGCSSAGSGTANSTNGGAATANSGSGGGGSDYTYCGGNGGSGLVVISVPHGSITATATGTYTEFQNINQDVWIFTGSGSLIVTATSGVNHGLIGFI